MNTEKYDNMEQELNYPSFKMRRENPELFYEQKEAYNEQLGKIKDKFKKDLLIHMNLDEHPKKDIIFDWCWTKAHSGGYSEVANEMEELVNLFQQMKL